jgi:hypothetical protein
MSTSRKSVRRSVQTVAPRVASSHAILLPVFFTVLLAALAFVPSTRQTPALFESILGAAAVMLAGTTFVWLRWRTRGFFIERSFRAQHYLQASMQASVLVYWGWYWRPVYEAIPLLAAQLAFAYAFDALLVWSRRDTYVAGFGPFPVVFSINLFLWFKPEWFYLQFCMIAMGFAAKEFIRWDKGGRPGHIFNPSSFPLAVFSIALILTGTTSWTWGEEIARTQFNPPNIYVLLFLIGLPGQLLFGVTTMTMSAVLTTYLFGLAYFGFTGVYYFVDSYVPVAVFLGMHLLFTDPSTSPRTELGRVIFGMLYGLGNVVLYALLRAGGIPAFYDKLLPVPILNLTIKAIDHLAQTSWLSRLSPARLGASWPPRRRYLAYVGVWTVAFIVLTATDGLGDHHPGHKVTFWQAACLRNAPGACENLSTILDTYCGDGSGWACNEVGALRWNRRVKRSDRFLDDFAQACALGSTTGCQNATSLRNDPNMKPIQVPPEARDYPVILRTGKGAIPERSPVDVLARACDEGWMSACRSVAVAYLQGKEVPREPTRALVAFDRACGGGIGSACSDVGLMHFNGDGVPQDKQKGLDYLKRACDMGMTQACGWYAETQRKEGLQPSRH